MDISDGLSLRLASFRDFVLAALPAPPARVLEVGCGTGDLALALARPGHDVTAIDPEAPDGPIFHAVRLEDFASGDPFDAVVASVSLHHVHDLDAATDRIHELLHPGGVLVLEEFSRERFNGRTARWYFEHLPERPEPDDFDTWLAEWHEEHAEHVHLLSDLRRSVDRRFVERSFAWGPYLYDYRLGDELEPVERALIASGAIEATGCRYVGERH